MPDYSLPKKNIPPQSPTQEPIMQLSQASQQRKLETENALLREALATSVQNCEALIMQFIESQTQFNKNFGEQIVWLQNQSEQAKHTIFTDMETIKKMLQQGEKNHQVQLIKLQNMNEAFSKNLNDVLTHTSDKLIAKVKAETDKALKSNIQAIGDSENTIRQTVSRITAYDKELKTLLNKRINAYQSSINQLFKLDGWRHKMFWAGVIGSIATPITLIITSFL